MDPLLPEALRFTREVKSNSGRQIYGEFLQTLKQYRKRNIDLSTVISTVQTLFSNHPNLFNGFNRLVLRCESAAAAAPTEISCAEFLNRASMRSSIDFLNRVGNRFDGCGPYLKFLDYMHAYSRGKIDAAAVHDKAAGLFGKSNDDLLCELARFLPEPSKGEGSRKRKIDQTNERQMRSSGGSGGNAFGSDEWRIRKSQRTRSSNSGGSAAAPSPEKFGSEELKVWERDNGMEDELCDIDVRIGRLEAARRNAVKLYLGVYEGRLSPAVVRLDKHLTAVDLVSVRSVGKKFLERFDRDLVFCKRSGDCDFLAKLFEMMEGLTEKKVALERMREKIVQRWNRIRQSS